MAEVQAEGGACEWIGVGENMLKPCVWYWIKPLSPKPSLTFQRGNEISRGARGNLLLICQKPLR